MINAGLSGVSGIEGQTTTSENMVLTWRQEEKCRACRDGSEDVVLRYPMDCDICQMPLIVEAMRVRHVFVRRRCEQNGVSEEILKRALLRWEGQLDFQ